MANEEVLEGLADIVEEVAGVAKDDVTVDKSFVDDLDIDSLSMVEIAVQAEDKFGGKIPDDQLAELKTVGDAVDYIAKNQGGPSCTRPVLRRQHEHSSRRRRHRARRDDPARRGRRVDVGGAA